MTTPPPAARPPVPAAGSGQQLSAEGPTADAVTRDQAAGTVAEDPTTDEVTEDPTAGTETTDPMADAVADGVSGDAGAETVEPAGDADPVDLTADAVADGVPGDATTAHVDGRSDAASRPASQVPRPRPSHPLIF